jgi:DNA-binding NarL/FixJ family response regulator
MEQLAVDTQIEQRDAVLEATKLRTVVVDDIPELLQCVTDRVMASGVIDVVGTACNGLEALQIATALKPDLVLMDVNMPVMDGFTSAREIKRAMPGVRVVLMSAETSPATRDLAARAGADQFIGKSKVLIRTCLLLQMFAS